MTLSSLRHLRHLRHHLFALVLLVATCALFVPPAQAVNVPFLDVQPRLFANAQAAHLAAPSGSGAPSFEIALDVTIRNDEPDPIHLQQVNYWFGAGISPMSAFLTDSIGIDCEGRDMELLGDNNEILPGETCKILLVEDVRVAPFLPQTISLTFFFENESPLPLDVPIVPYGNAQLGGAFQFFGSAHDLAPGEYWSARYTGDWHRHRKFSDQIYAYDVGVVRWDDDLGDWTRFHPLSPGETDNGDDNEDWLVWGKPIYAMADGIVSRCSDGAVDNPPGNSDNPANFFEIDHGPETARYYHLRNGTLNPLLCVAGAVVQAGDYLGEVGNSGLTSNPHLHIDVMRGSQGFPLNFTDVYIADRTTFVTPEDPLGNADWSFVGNKALPWEQLAVWPAPIVHRGVTRGGKGSQPVVLDQSADQKIVGSKNAQGRLELRSYDKFGDGSLSESGKVVGETIKALDLARPSINPFFVSAVIDANDQIHLTEWDIFLNQGVEVWGGTASDLAVATSPHMPGLVTASRNQAGQLRVMGWDHAWGVGIFQGDVVDGGLVDRVSIATGDAFEGVVTASQTSTGLLSLSSWSVNVDESLIAHQDTELDIAIKDVEIAHLGQFGGDDRFVTAVRNGADRLQLITWSVSPGGAIARLDDATGGKVADLDVADGGDFHAVTAVRDHGSGALEIAAWEIDNAGQITLAASIPGEGIREVSVGSPHLVNPTTREQLVTAIRDDSNIIEIVSWEWGLEQ